MSDPVMPVEVRDWMGQRNWGLHHLEWHTSRQWDRLPPSARSWAEQQGWRRAVRQEGQTGNGLEFLIMHRAMIELLRQQFPQHAALFAGWKTPPTNPADPADPLPNQAASPFDQAKEQAIQRLEKQPNLFQDDDAVGLFVETSFRPTPANPFARSSDPSTGIHNYIHSRYQDSTSPVDMGNPLVNLDNQRFWRLHGWIDNVWTEYRRAAGLSDFDPTYRKALDEQKMHLQGHMGVVAAGQTPASWRGLASVVPVTVQRPFRESLAARFNRLMTTTPRPQNVDELIQYLQVAVQLEHFTIPLYLTAMWSLKPGPTTNDHRGILRSVVLDEMLHLGLVANLLVAVGGKLKINDPTWVPQYPDVLPGISDPEVFGLEVFSQTQVQRFLRIELPEHGPISRGAGLGLPGGATFKTIGDFYSAIDQALATLTLTFNPAGQRAYPFGASGDLKVVRSVDDARKAVQLIKEQGEGTEVSQGAADFGGALAHYYRFEQILKQQKYVPQAGGGFKLDPNSPLPLPQATEVRAMAPIPRGGYPGVPGADQFNQLYTQVIDKLQEAWEADSDSALQGAVDGMMTLGGPAKQLMDKPRDPPYGPGNYGPPFVYLRTGGAVAPPAGAGGSQALAGVGLGAVAPPAPTVPGYARIQQILDDAVQGQAIGKHGPFWRTSTRDQFVSHTVFGRKVIATRPDGSFDPNESNLVKALEGRAPFGADLPVPPAGAVFDRMPVGFPPVHPDRIAEIRAWIQGGCPERSASGAAWWDANAGGPGDPGIHVAFWRDFDDRSMYHATDQTQQDINTFFAVADAWLTFAKDPTKEAAWAQSLAAPDVRDSVGRLEALQRSVVAEHYGRPVPLLTVLDGFQQFGADQLPTDPNRPPDPHHRMNGKIMWFYWCAFCDACLRVGAGQAALPADFWRALGRCILLGLLNDGLFRHRFTVTGFSADAVGQKQALDFTRQLPDAQVAVELATRYRASGL